MKKLILFGGTFDPVHNGHITVARAAAKEINASKIVLIPARRSPHKQQKPLAADNDRVAMLKLATVNDDTFEICTIELNRAEPSYTIDTINYFKERFGANYQFNWLIGADMLKDLPRWYKAKDLLNECNICVMHRGGFDVPNFDCLKDKFTSKTIEKLRKNMIKTPSIDISSTKIRKRILDSQDVSQLISMEVLSYIEKHKLYTTDARLNGEDI